MPFSLGLPLQEDLPTYIIMRPLRLLKLYKGQNTTNTTIMKDMTLFRFKMFQENKTGPSPSPRPSHQNNILEEFNSISTFLHKQAITRIPGLMFKTTDQKSKQDWNLGHFVDQKSKQGWNLNIFQGQMSKQGWNLDLLGIQ